jgi:hypothetical protein
VGSDVKTYVKAGYPVLSCLDLSQIGINQGLCLFVRATRKCEMRNTKCEMKWLGENNTFT